jgi:hypothetical protein
MPCPGLPPARSAKVPDLLANHDQVVALYGDCAAGKASLSAAVDEWETTAWAWYCNAAAEVGLDATACNARRAKP